MRPNLLKPEIEWDYASEELKACSLCGEWSIKTGTYPLGEQTIVICRVCAVMTRRELRGILGLTLGAGIHTMRDDVLEETCRQVFRSIIRAWMARIVSITLEHITPQKAEAYLHGLRRNIVSPARVCAYAQQMKQDKWRLTGETLKFNEAGVLLDGQHRLCACVEAQVPFESSVVIFKGHSWSLLSLGTK